MVFLHSNFFRKDLPQHRGFISMKTPFPTNSTFTLNQLAQEALSKIYKAGVPYKKAGVIVADLTPTAAYQLGLFESENPKHIEVMQTVDALNARYGQVVKFANNDLKKRWKMRQMQLSQRYTTSWNELLEVS
jgi:DNA polymerase V